jgi:hypothetical protein
VAYIRPHESSKISRSFSALLTRSWRGSGRLDSEVELVEFLRVVVVVSVLVVASIAVVYLSCCSG